MSVTLSPNYGYTIISAALIGFECIMIGFLVPGRLRWKIYPKMYMEKNHGEMHFEATKTEIKAGGLPDMGCGRYSEQLPYADWLLFNKAQRFPILS